MVAPFVARDRAGTSYALQTSGRIRHGQARERLLNTPDISDDALLDSCRTTARAAAAIHDVRLGELTPDDWTAKGGADFVTDVDREAEDAIVSRIRDAYPDHAVLAEEAADDAAAQRAPEADDTAGKSRHSAQVEPDAGSDWLWIIDPLDGTTNFLHGYPMYAASVAVAHRGELVAGAVACSATGEEWWAARERGAFRDGQPIRVSGIERLEHALIGTGFPFKTLEMLAEYQRQFERVLRTASGVRRAGSAALDLCHLASGYFDGFWELRLAPWDVAAGTLIVREAGGIVTTLDGADDVLRHGSILAGNPAVYPALHEILREAG